MAYRGYQDGYGASDDGGEVDPPPVDPGEPGTFTPPSINDGHPILVGSHPGNKLMRHFRARPSGRNVWQLADGSYSFAQPYPLFTAREAAYQAGSNNDITATYRRVFYGGSTHTVTEAESDALRTFLAAEGYDPDEWLA